MYIYHLSLFRYLPVWVDKKGFGDWSFKPRLIWLDAQTRSFHWSKSDIKEKNEEKGTAAAAAGKGGDSIKPTAVTTESSKSVVIDATCLDISLSTKAGGNGGGGIITLNFGSRGNIVLKVWIFIFLFLFLFLFSLSLLFLFLLLLLLLLLLLASTH